MRIFSLCWIGLLLLTSVAAAAETEFAPKQDTLPVPPPKNAIVLYDGKGTNLFLNKQGQACDWKEEDGVLISSSNKNRSNHTVSAWHFRDADIHVEFATAKGSNGNSGVYIHGNYEMQIFDSYGKANPDAHDEGALYDFHKPLVNAARPLGEWQVYDIRYRAPRRDDSGKIVEEGVITAWLNGQKVQEQAKFGEPKSVYHPYRYQTTDYLKKIWERQKQTGVGPVFLQDHDSPCRYRNVWIVPLDDKAVKYEDK